MSNAIEFIVKGQVFKAKKVTGDWTFIYCLGRMRDGFVYFVHAGRHKVTGGARITKHEYEHTVKVIEDGVIVPVPKEEVDWDKFIPSSLGLTAVANNMGTEECIDAMCAGELNAASKYQEKNHDQIS